MLRDHLLIATYRQLFRVQYLCVYALAAVLTYILVVTGADWNYNWYVHTYINTRLDILGFADGLGFLAALLFCTAPALGYFFTGRMHLKYRAITVLSILIIGLSISTGIKALAGRESPPHFHPSYAAEGLVKMDTWRDNSDNFQFGFLREQVFGGYPSSHATLFFAFASQYLFSIRARRQRLHTREIITAASLCVLALFISIGVSFGHHWLSESVAGALLGICIGHALAQHARLPKN